MFRRTDYLQFDTKPEKPDPACATTVAPNALFDEEYAVHAT